MVPDECPVDRRLGSDSGVRDKRPHRLQWMAACSPLIVRDVHQDRSAGFAIQFVVKPLAIPCCRHSDPAGHGVPRAHHHLSKFGALSRPQRRLEVRWSVCRPDGYPKTL